MEIIEKKENKLLNRTEIVALDEYLDITPSREEVRKKIAESLKANEELVVIKNIFPIFGKRSATVIAHIYENKEDCERVEPKYIFSKGKKDNKQDNKQKPASK